jgi:hypothetical protein
MLVGANEKEKLTYLSNARQDSHVGNEISDLLLREANN